MTEQTSGNLATSRARYFTVTYYMLTKPGIIMGNVLTTVAGFILAAKGHFYPWLFLATILGLSLVMASACVYNNYLDRDIDAKMERTKNRALVQGTISVRNALLFGAVLGLLGFIVLGLYTNLVTLFVAAAGFFVYVLIYSLWKCRTAYGTIIGSFSGAIPPLVGYCAVSNCFDTAALLLFLTLVLWQMPHFFAIATYRLHDYVAAGIPVLPVRKGLYTTKIHMMLYIIAFTVTACALTPFGYTGYVYLVSTSVLGLIWLQLCLQGFKTDNNIHWARQMFRFSLVVIITLCIVLSLDVKI